MIGIVYFYGAIGSQNSVSLAQFNIFEQYHKINKHTLVSPCVSSPLSFNSHWVFFSFQILLNIQFCNKTVINMANNNLHYVPIVSTQSLDRSNCRMR